MEKKNIGLENALGLFGETNEAAGANADAGRAADGQIVGISGGSAVDAGRQEKDAPSAGDAAANAKASAADAEKDAASEAAETDREKEFEELIKGKYRAQYARRMSETVKARLKNRAAEAKRYAEVLPALTGLARRLGVDPEDGAALLEALDALSRSAGEGSGGGDAAESASDGDAEGPTPGGNAAESASDKNAEPAAEDAALTRLADGQYDEWMKEARALKEVFPSFDLERELESDEFRELLRAGVKIGTAFRALHEEEVLPRIIRRAGEDAVRRVADSVASGGMRPGEYGAGGKTPGVTVTDVSRLSKAQRDELIRRAERGEIISF